MSLEKNSALNLLSWMANWYKGDIIINGISYDAAEQAYKAMEKYTGEVEIFLNKKEYDDTINKTVKALMKKLEGSQETFITLKNKVEVYICANMDNSNVYDLLRRDIQDVDYSYIYHAENLDVIAQELHRIVDTEPAYRFKVKEYMIQPATKEFDFHLQWNDNIPMPFMIMNGRIIQETKGMYRLICWMQLREKESYCFKCGRLLTNEVSQIFGLGPECSGKYYKWNPELPIEEMTNGFDDYVEYLESINWVGWVPKSAIKEQVQII